MNLIVAVDEQFAIGRNGDLLTYLPKDLDFFKGATLNKVLVMGSKTLMSFKNQKPLPKRQHIVLSRTMNYEHERVVMVRNLEELGQQVAKYDPEDVFVAGGGQVYDLLLPYCQKAYITMIEATFEADTFMTNIKELDNWEMVESSELITEEGGAYRHTTWINHQVQSLT